MRHPLDSAVVLVKDPQDQPGWDVAPFVLAVESRQGTRNFYPITRWMIDAEGQTMTAYQTVHLSNEATGDVSMVENTVIAFPYQEQAWMIVARPHLEVVATREWATQRAAQRVEVEAFDKGLFGDRPPREDDAEQEPLVAIVRAAQRAQEPRPDTPDGRPTPGQYL